MTSAFSWHNSIRLFQEGGKCENKETFKAGSKRHRQMSGDETEEETSVQGQKLQAEPDS